MAEDRNRTVFEKSGVVLEIPESFGKLKGSYGGLLDVGALDTGNGTAVATAIYIPKSEEELNAIGEKRKQGAESDEEMGKIALELLTSSVELFRVIGVNGTRSLEEAMTGIDAEWKKKLTEPAAIGELNGFAYYLFVLSEESERYREIDRFPSDLKEEYIRLRAELLKNPGYFSLIPQKVEDKFTRPGTKVSFELTDLEGRKVSSAELFAGAKITIADVWRTWCHFCIEEFPDLDELERKYRDQGVQVITVCDDAENEELTAKAKEIVQPYSFRTFVQSESFNQALIYEGTPTTYFLDSEGRVLGNPVVGKRPEVLKERLLELLEGGTAAAPQESHQASAVYTVTVKDQDGNPVPEITLGFCSDSTCNAAVTDSEGTAVYEGAAYPWHLQILRMPEGYRDPETEERYTKEESETLCIVLEKS